MTFEAPRHAALAQQFHAMHPFAGKTTPRIVFWPGSYLCAASAVVAAPSSSECTAEVFLRPQGLVARDGTGGDGLPRLRVLARWIDGGCARFGDGVVALSGVVGAVRCPATVCRQTVRGGGDTGDLLIGWNLVKQLRQHGAAPTSLLVISTARTCSVCSWSSGKHSPGLFSDPGHSTCLHPRNLMPVLSIKRCSDPCKPRYGMFAARIF